MGLNLCQSELIWNILVVEEQEFHLWLPNDPIFGSFDFINLRNVDSGKEIWKTPTVDTTEYGFPPKYGT